MDATKNCPYCAEEIRAEAVRCRYCRSSLEGSPLSGWRRDHADRRLAGVCSAVAHGLHLPLALVRLGFIILTFVHLLGAIAYAALWLAIPAREGEDPILEMFLQEGRSLCRRVRGDRHRRGGSSHGASAGGGPPMGGATGL
jgi:phage shock protein PspC (stress-responsive transcriptional regulator)